MALTLITNPVGSAASKFFAGFQKCEVVFKREDLAITDVESGSGGIQINVGTDLTSYLAAGDVIYVYSEGADYTYNGTGTILGITATDITIDIPFVQAATGGYINYFKNYYVELQCVNPALPGANLLPFSLESDGDAAGNIRIDVSIVNELNVRRGVITAGHETGTVKEFEIKYRQVYSGSAESFTLVDNKLFIMLCCIDVPEEGILNQLDTPTIYLGYPAAIAVALKALPASSTIELVYRELDINMNEVAIVSIGTKPGDVNGFIVWKWLESWNTESASSKYIEFNFVEMALYDFRSPDFAYPDFLTE